MLTVTQILRREGVVGKFVEFYGTGVDAMSLADRATIANMAPEYGATMGFFPVDDETLDYLRRTGRSHDDVDLVERYMKEQGLFRTGASPIPEYTKTLSLDLATVEPCLAGPEATARSRGAVPRSRHPSADALDRSRGRTRICPQRRRRRSARVPCRRPRAQRPDRTRRGRDRGDHQLHQYQQSVGHAGGRAVGPEGRRQGPARAATRQDQPGARLARGHRLPGQGRTDARRSNNSVSIPSATAARRASATAGRLPEPVAQAVTQGNLVAAAVLSGNRNFEGRVNPLVKANYLASPPLVVAYALAGTVDVDLATEPLGTDASGQAVFLRDIWPTPHGNPTGRSATCVLPEMFTDAVRRSLGIQCASGMRSRSPTPTSTSGIRTAPTSRNRRSWSI